jgi:hypothetical protein
MSTSKIHMILIIIISIAFIVGAVVDYKAGYYWWVVFDLLGAAAFAWSAHKEWRAIRNGMNS